MKKQNTAGEKEALQNFANNFNMEVHIRIDNDSRKNNTYFLQRGNDTISPCLDYEGINHFLLGWSRCTKQLTTA